MFGTLILSVHLISQLLPKIYTTHDHHHRMLLLMAAIVAEYNNI